MIEPDLTAALFGVALFFIPLIVIGVIGYLNADRLERWTEIIMKKNPRA